MNEIDNTREETNELPPEFMCVSCAEEPVEIEGLCSTCKINYIEDFSEYL
jgi:hypothetical protein